MSTTNYAKDNPAIGHVFGGTDFYGFRTVISEVEATGTQVAIKFLQVTAGEVYLSIDGGAETLIGSYDSSFTSTTMTLYTGLSDTSRDLSIRFTGYAVLDATDYLQVTGAAPAISLPARFGQSYGMRGLSYIQVDDVPTTDNGSFVSFLGYQIGIGGQVHRFKGTISSIRFLMQRISGTESKVVLWRRAAASTGAWTEVGTATLTDTTGQLLLSTTITGLDDSQEWQYAAVFIGPGICYLIGMNATGSGMSYSGGDVFVGSVVNQTALTSQGFAVFWGDSITINYNLNVAEGFVYKVCRALGLTFHNQGSAGETVVNGATRSATVFGTTITTSPNYLIVMEGVNDNLNEFDGSSSATFQSSATTILDNAFTEFPGMKGIVFGILPCPQFEATHPKTDAAWAAAVAAQTSVCSFHSSDGITNLIAEPTADADFQSDGVHPTDQGNTKIAAFLEPFFAAPPAVTGEGGFASGPATFGGAGTIGAHIPKTTVYDNNQDDADLDNDDNWDEGAPVAGDTATIAGEAGSGTIPAGVDLNFSAGALRGACVFNSVIKVLSGGDQIFEPGPEYNYGIDFNGFILYGPSNTPEGGAEEQLATDVAAVTAKADKIITGNTILGVAGTARKYPTFYEHR